MLTNLALSFLICVVIIILTYIIINSAILLEKLRIRTNLNNVDVDVEDPEPFYTDLEFQEGLTDREYNALSFSIKEIETADPSAVFLTSNDLSMYDKMKGSVYYNSPINFLGSYDNKNIVNYIDALVKINNTTDKNFNELSVSSKKDGDVYSNYSGFVNMKQYLKKNKPTTANISESQKLLEQQETDERIKGTILNKNLEVIISNKLDDMLVSLYNDYAKYITDVQGIINIVQNKNKTKINETTVYMNELANPLITNIDKSISSLKNGISDLNSLNIKKIGSFLKINFAEEINNKKDDLYKYIKFYEDIKTTKITKSTTETNNIPVSIVSTINVYSNNMNDENANTNNELDAYLKKQTDDYNEFLIFYNKFNNEKYDVDFITRIEQEYLADDYKNKLNKNSYDNNKTEIQVICDKFTKKCDEYISKLNVTVSNVAYQINNLTPESNDVILKANNVYIKYINIEKNIKDPIGALGGVLKKKNKKCVIM